MRPTQASGVMTTVFTTHNPSMASDNNSNTAYVRNTLTCYLRTFTLFAKLSMTYTSAESKLNLQRVTRGSAVNADSVLSNVCVFKFYQEHKSKK